MHEAALTDSNIRHMVTGCRDMCWASKPERLGPVPKLSRERQVAYSDYQVTRLRASCEQITNKTVNEASCDEECSQLNTLVFEVHGTVPHSPELFASVQLLYNS